MATDCATLEEASTPAPALSPRIPEGEHWRNVKKWVVFSDLHVSPKTAEVCCQVLQKVREEAEALDAGILFLGDFWHARGSLPVTPLNLVLEQLALWRQPTLMLVGNHDQVTLGGLDHGLTPIAKVCPCVHVIEEPTLFLDALWLPYRRDHLPLERALQEAGPVKAVFGHADVLGAFVNETFQARQGLEPSVFGSVKTYLGHYHKPHTVGTTNVSYVGSPYQVSRSESGQEKKLVVLNQDWQQIDAIPLDLGPRHFAFAGPENILSQDLRLGDRVRITLEGDDEAAKVMPAVKQLQSEGIEVEVVTAAKLAAPRIEDAEDMGALHLFHTYADEVSMTPQARERGLAILEDVGEVNGQQLRHEAVHVEFESLELEGYGPFRERTVYNIGDRGLTVVSGRNEDDAGADSNGTGKSALVMAAMWGLTGKSDCRAMTGNAGKLSGSEVVNDDSKVALVKVTGMTNGKPFVVERSVKRRGLAGLYFTLDGEDMTGADSRLTQATLERHLACSLLTRVVFHSQSDIAGLLEADDKDFKNELGRVVEMDVWDNTKVEAVRQLKEASARLLKLQQEQEFRSRRLEELNLKAEAAKRMADGWEGEREDRLFEARNTAEHHAADLSLQMAAAEAGASVLRESLANYKGYAGDVTDEEQWIRSEVDSLPEVPLPGLNEEDLQLAAELRTRLAMLQDEASRRQMEAGSAAGALQASKRQLDGYLKLKHDEAGMVCDVCLQPIEEELYSQNAARLQDQVVQCQSRQAEATREAAAAKEEFQRVEQELGARERAIQAAQQQLQQWQWQRDAEQRAREAERQRRQAEVARNRAAAEAQRQTSEGALKRTMKLLEDTAELLGDARLPARPSTMPLPQAASGSLEVVTGHQMTLIDTLHASGSHYNTAKQRLVRQQTEVNPHQGSVEVLRGLIQKEEQDVAAAEAQVGAAVAEVGWLKEVDTAFGRGGILSFALEGVLNDLQIRTSHYLEQLSSGMTLSLSATKPKAGSRGKEGEVSEKITKAVLVRTGEGGSKVQERSVRQLSGGERRRVALGLALGFAEVATARARLRSNLLVLDEVLQQLDEEGCSRMARILKRMDQDNILVVAQADSHIMRAFDRTDIVVKQAGCARVEAS